MILALGIGLGYLLFNDKLNLGGTSITQSWYGTSATTTVGTSATNVFAQTGNPGKRLLVNNASATIHCFFDGGTAAANSGVNNAVGYAVAPSSTGETGANVLDVSGYLGNVNCISVESADVTKIE